MLNILKQERRYTVFDSSSYSHLIKLLGTMTTYTMDDITKTKVVDYYYDSPNSILEQNELLLRKRVSGGKAQLKIKRRYLSPQFYYSDNLRSHERERDVGVHDSLSKHFFFLNNALNSMFSTTLQFDPDKLFAQMRVVMIVKSSQEIRKLYGYGGLKVEIKQEKLKVQNKKTNRKNKTEMVQFKLLSSDETLPLFEDLITKIERHCKELFYTQDSKYEICFKATKPLPTKEELKKMKEEFERKKQMELSAENYSTNKGEKK